MKNYLVECKYCGWQHFAVTRRYAEDEVDSFNMYYDSLSPEEQEQNYGNKKSSIRLYERCNFCDKPANMGAPTKELFGNTIGPIIWETENDETTETKS